MKILKVFCDLKDPTAKKVGYLNLHGKMKSLNDTRGLSRLFLNAKFDQNLAEELLNGFIDDFAEEKYEKLLTFYHNMHNDKEARIILRNFTQKAFKNDVKSIEKLIYFADKFDYLSGTGIVLTEILDQLRKNDLIYAPQTLYLGFLVKKNMENKSYVKLHESYKEIFETLMANLPEVVRILIWNRSCHLENVSKRGFLAIKNNQVFVSRHPSRWSFNTKNGILFEIITSKMNEYLVSTEDDENIYKKIVKIRNLDGSFNAAEWIIELDDTLENAIFIRSKDSDRYMVPDVNTQNVYSLAISKDEYQNDLWIVKAI